MLFQKKTKQGNGEGFEDILFEKYPGFLFGKTLEIPGKTKLHPWRFGKIMYITSLGNFKAKNEAPWKFHMKFS